MNGSSRDSDWPIFGLLRATYHSYEDDTRFEASLCPAKVHHATDSVPSGRALKCFLLPRKQHHHPNSNNRGREKGRNLPLLHTQHRVKERSDNCISKSTCSNPLSLWACRRDCEKENVTEGMSLEPTTRCNRPDGHNIEKLQRQNVVFHRRGRQICLLFEALRASRSRSTMRRNAA